MRQEGIATITIDKWAAVLTDAPEDRMNLLELRDGELQIRTNVRSLALEIAEKCDVGSCEFEGKFLAHILIKLPKWARLPQKVVHIGNRYAQCRAVNPGIMWGWAQEPEKAYRERVNLITCPKCLTTMERDTLAAIMREKMREQP